MTEGPWSGSRAIRAAGWTVGVVLIGVGLLGVAGGWGLPWLVAGILVTPRTRSELFDLATIWVRSRDDN